MTLDEHIQILRDLMVREQEQRIAEVEAWADEAAAAGQPEREQRHRSFAARLRAMPYPWDRDQDRAA